MPSFLKVLVVQRCGRARFSVSCRSLSLWPRSLLAPLGPLWTWKPRTLVFSKMIICDPAIFVASFSKAPEGMSVLVRSWEVLGSKMRFGWDWMGWFTSLPRGGWPPIWARG